MKYFVFEVDCVKNDPVDYKAGGPYYLGFDFTIKAKTKEIAYEYEKLIRKALKKYDIPLDLGIRFFECNDTLMKNLKILERKHWTAKETVEEIKRFKGGKF